MSHPSKMRRGGMNGRGGRAESEDGEREATRQRLTQFTITGHNFILGDPIMTFINAILRCKLNTGLGWWRMVT